MVSTFVSIVRITTREKNYLENSDWASTGRRRIVRRKLYTRKVYIASSIGNENFNFFRRSSSTSASRSIAKHRDDNYLENSDWATTNDRKWKRSKITGSDNQIISWARPKSVKIIWFSCVAISWTSYEWKFKWYQCRYKQLMCTDGSRKSNELTAIDLGSQMRRGNGTKESIFQRTIKGRKEA